MLPLVDFIRHQILDLLSSFGVFLSFITSYLDSANNLDMHFHCDHCDNCDNGVSSVKLPCNDPHELCLSLYNNHRTFAKMRNSAIKRLFDSLVS